MIALPTFILCAVTFIAARMHHRNSCWVPLALLLSAAGDYAGSTGYFYPQMGLFAAALLCYLRALAPTARFTAERIRPLLLLLVVLLVGFGYLVSHIEPLGEVVAVSLYAILLLSLAAAALIQHRPHWGWYPVAALLFLLSDALLGYTRFVAPLHNAAWWILPPYYAAQSLFALLYLYDRPRTE